MERGKDNVGLDTVHPGRNDHRGVGRADHRSTARRCQNLLLQPPPPPSSHHRAHPLLRLRLGSLTGTETLPSLGHSTDQTEAHCAPLRIIYTGRRRTECITNGPSTLCRQTPKPLSSPSLLACYREETVRLPTRQTTAPRRGSGQYHFGGLRNVRRLD